MPDKRHSIDDNAIFRKLEPAELAGLENTSGKVKARLDAMRNWLEDHPEARRILKGRKGKGKRVDDGVENNEIVQAEATHFKDVLQEIEPTEILQDLVDCTKDWLAAFVCRVNVVKKAWPKSDLLGSIASLPAEHFPLATGDVHTAQADISIRVGTLVSQNSQQTGTADKGTPAEEPTGKQDQAVGTEAPQQRRLEHTSRRKTMDRGTSPLRVPEQRSPSPAIPPAGIQEIEQDTQASSTQKTTSTNSTEAASFRSEGRLYSPDSLPSRPASPAPGQIRKPVPSRDLNDPPISSVESQPGSVKRERELDLPPLHSSNPSDELRTHTDLVFSAVVESDTTLKHDTAEVEQVDALREVKKIRRPDAEAEPDMLQLDFTPAMQARFAARAAEVEKERLRLRALEEDPPKNSWANLQFYIPPDRLFLAKPIVQDVPQDHESDGSHDARATSVAATFASLGDGSEAGSLDEEERSITSFLHREKTEDEMLL
jgi:hypothetical protein